MKKLDLLLLLFLSCFVSAQNTIEKEITTKVNEVTVFIKGAQITRKTNVDISKGASILKFTDLSPFINAKSIQVKAAGDIVVLSVKQQQNFLEKSKKSKELLTLESQNINLQDKINIEKTHIDILKEEQKFLQDNRNINGKNETLSVADFKQIAEFYGSKLTTLKLKEIDRNKILQDLYREKTEIENQIKTITSKKEYPSGEILVEIDAKISGTIAFEISYLVENASWYPSYDIRAKNINEPINLVYKANIKQDTKVNWEKVSLKLSSADPNISGVTPELKTYYLNYNSAPPNYDKVTNSVSGKVLDQDNQPLPGANVFVQGTTIGTTTDFDGNYSISVPNNSGNLTFSFVGYVTQTLAINGAIMNVYMQEDAQALEEVVVVGYGTTSKLRGAVSGIAIEESAPKVIKTSIPFTPKENQTSVDFEIKTPYTIESNNKNFSVDLDTYSLPANYVYYSVPKIEKNAYLISNILDWEKYNLLEGEANIFFEDTYIGKSLLDVRYATDTLQISLGQDKNVSIQREKIKEYTSSKFIGKNKRELIGWKTIIKNNKNEAINMIVLDQIPVSTLEEISIEIEEISKGKLNSETGEVQWSFVLEPKDQKQFNLKYEVKYPKYKNLIIE
jgi:hypothetical protein